MDVFALTMKLKEEGAAQVRAALTSMRAGLKSTEKDAKQLSTAMTGMSQHARTLASSLAAVAGGAATLRAIDTYAMMNNQLKLATTSTQGFVKAQADVIRIAQATNQPVEAVAQLYGRVSRAAATLGLSQEQVAKLTETVGQALIVSGADAGAAAGALTQLGQALAAGVVRAEEFNSIMDGAPALIQGVEKSLGLLPGALRKMSAEGKLSSQVFSQAILNATTISSQFAQMVPTLSQQMVGLRNQFVLMAGRIAETTGATTKMGEAIQGIKQNLSQLIAIVASATTAFVVYRGALIGAAVASAVLTSAQTVAAFLSLARAVRSVADAGALLNAAGGGWLKLAGVLAGAAASAGVYIMTQRALSKALAETTAVTTQQTTATTQQSIAVKAATVDQIGLLVELADVTQLTATQMNTLRGAETQFIAQLSAGNIGLEQRVKLSKQLSSVQASLGEQLALKMPTPAPIVQKVTARQEITGGPAKITAVSPQVIGQVKENFATMNAAIDEQAEKTLDNLRTGFAAQLGGTFADALGAGFEAAFATGSISEGFKAFGSAMLSGLGGMLQSFGKQALLASTLMAKLMESFGSLNPYVAVAASIALIALGGALKGAASSAFGGGGQSANVSTMGGGYGGGSMRSSAQTLPTITYGPTSAASGSAIRPASAMNVTIIGPNDPSAQRAMQELIMKADRRGNV